MLASAELILSCTWSRGPSSLLRTSCTLSSSIAYHADGRDDASTSARAPAWRNNTTSADGASGEAPGSVTTADSLTRAPTQFVVVCSALICAARFIPVAQAQPNPDGVVTRFIEGAPFSALPFQTRLRKLLVGHFASERADRSGASRALDRHVRDTGAPPSPSHGAPTRTQAKARGAQPVRRSDDGVACKGHRRMHRARSSTRRRACAKSKSCKPAAQSSIS